MVKNAYLGDNVKIRIKISRMLHVLRIKLFKRKLATLGVILSEKIRFFVFFEVFQHEKKFWKKYMLYMWVSYVTYIFFLLLS